MPSAITLIMIHTYFCHGSVYFLHLPLQTVHLNYYLVEDIRLPSHVIDHCLLGNQFLFFHFAVCQWTTDRFLFSTILVFFWPPDTTLCFVDRKPLAQHYTRGDNHKAMLSQYFQPIPHFLKLLLTSTIDLWQTRF